ncbi:TELO2-interacting protein 1 homolog isoform X2 [Protopterus annectens]|nr:TELO2-interacting protein 1 homolog isoform X2 [Protopterus annectens]
MTMIDTPKEAFAALRPVCVKLTKEHTIENVYQLKSALKTVSGSALQELQEYVLFPLRFILNSPGLKKEGLVLSVVECITYVVSLTCIKGEDLFQKLLSELYLCLCSSPNFTKPAPLSEELKMAIVKGLDALLHSVYGDSLLTLYQPSSLPVMGHILSLLLALVEQEKSRPVKVVMLNVLQTLIQQCDCSELHMLPDDVMNAVGNTFASFLPGITLSLSRVITGDIKQGHMVTVRALAAWYKTVGLVMADNQLLEVQMKKEEPPPVHNRAAELVIQRTPEWVKSTGNKASVLVKKIVECCSNHPHWKVRKELLNFAYHLLSRCHKSLKDSVGHLLEAVVGLVNDESLEVKKKSTEILRNIADQKLVSENKAFTDVLSENLHTLATALPRLMRSHDDKNKLSTLNLLLGYIKLLGPKVSVVLNSVAHLERLSKALIQVLELDITDIRIVEERRACIEGASGCHSSDLCSSRKLKRNAVQKRHFRYFTDEQIFTLLQQLCRVLGYYGNHYLLIDHFIDLYRESAVYRKQACLIINELIIGASGMDLEELHETENPISTDDLKAVINSVIEEYTSLANWHLVSNILSDYDSLDAHESHTLAVTAFSEVHNFSSSNISSNISSMNSNILQLCIQLEGIGVFAQVLQNEFALLLICSLYPVMEKAGDDSLLVSQTAMATLMDISHACGYKSLKELINQNSDYLINAVSLNLRQLGQHPHAPKVLGVMFMNSDSSLLPLVKDVVQDVLMTLDQSYDERAHLFFSVLHTLMGALVRWFQSETFSLQDSKKSKEIKDGFLQDQNKIDTSDVRRAQEELEHFLLDYQRQKRLSEGDIEDDCLDSENQQPVSEPDVEDMSPDVKKELPVHIQIAKDVIERCIHLLSHRSLKLRLKVLDVLEMCVIVLQSHENELLPAAHRVWPPLVQRLTNDDPRVVRQAFQTLCILGEKCGNFLRSRVTKDVLPKLSNMLQSHASVSIKAGPLYTHTLAYKLQLTVLQGLGTLCEKLDLAENGLDVVINAAVPYLSSRQPCKLQEASCRMFIHLMQIDPDAVWLFLNELYCSHSYEPPHASLHPVKLQGMGNPRNEYTDNVSQLLDKL